MGSTEYRSFAVEERDVKVGSRGWLAVFTGLNLAFLVCSLGCKSPAPNMLSWKMRLVSSVGYLVLACVAGAFGTWVLLPRDARMHFRDLAQCGVRAWIFLPALSLFLQQESLLAAFVAIVAAVLMAAYTCRFANALPEYAAARLRSQRSVGQGLFASEVHVAPPSWVPFVVAVCVYGSITSAAARRPMIAVVLLAAGTFLLGLQTTAARIEREQAELKPVERRSRLPVLIGVAFGCTVLALSSAHSADYGRMMQWSRARKSPTVVKEVSLPEKMASGYHLIVLWPIEKQEKVLPQPPLSVKSSAAGIAKPWIIPFYGPYWYFKSAGEVPGRETRTTHGDPLKVNVHSTDRSPLLMEAHQRLADPINLACCREIHVVLRNDAALGAGAVGLSLTDSHSGGKLTQNLGVRYVAPAAVAVGERSLHEETFVFEVPSHGKIQQFDGMTVSLLPEGGHLTGGRKTAIERFVMVPR